MVSNLLTQKNIKQHHKLIKSIVYNKENILTSQIYRIGGIEETLTREGMRIDWKGDQTEFKTRKQTNPIRF